MSVNDNLKKLKCNESGTVVALITWDDQVILADMFSREVIRKFKLNSDTADRISFDLLLDRILIGSWKKGLWCFKISSGEQMWYQNLSMYTWNEILSKREEVFVSGFSEPRRNGLILDLQTGKQIKKLENCNEIICRKNIMLGCNRVAKKLLIYDLQWKLAASPDWPSWTMYDFACDEAGKIVVLGADGYIATFNAHGKKPFAEIQSKQYGCMFQKIIWNHAHKSFFAVACDFEGREGYDLVKLDAQLKSVKSVRKLSALNDKAIINGNILLEYFGGTMINLDSLSDLISLDSLDGILNSTN